MTAPRGKIEASLAERGRPALWANEQEAAVLSGYPSDGVKYRAALAEMENGGFPQVNPKNGLRYIPAIIDFWARQIDAPMRLVPECGTGQRHLENFPNGRQKAAS